MEDHLCSQRRSALKAPAPEPRGSAFFLEPRARNPQAQNLTSAQQEDMLSRFSWAESTWGTPKPESLKGQLRRIGGFPVPWGVGLGQRVSGLGFRTDPTPFYLLSACSRRRGGRAGRGGDGAIAWLKTGWAVAETTGIKRIVWGVSCLAS